VAQDEVAVVVIGRNEGERLRRCLESVAASRHLLVYVDSGSTDGSVQTARSLGADVVPLDMARPFTAARARNAGWSRALAIEPTLQFVQFVDGDCEVQPGWIAQARDELVRRGDVAALAGRRRERHPEASVYNRLCDLEWAVAPGPAKSVGGDAMFRVSALRQCGGYRDDLIAGEEPELCVRLRRQGWRIEILPTEMTLHDAAMTSFRQWWLRNVRAGYAYAEGAALHGAPPERHCVRPLRSALGWSAGVPSIVVLGAAAVGPWGLALLLAYPAQVLRLSLCETGPASTRFARGLFLVLGKFAETQGAIRYWWRRRHAEAGALIEYK
jgi:GT2 family glycosyltransferase